MLLLLSFAVIASVLHGYTSQSWRSTTYAIEDDESVVVIDTEANSSVRFTHNFNFSCAVTDPGLNLTLLIDGYSDSDKHNRTDSLVIPKDSTTVYTFEDVEPSDNGTTFACMASNETDNFTSETLVLQAVGAPIFETSNNDGSQYQFIKKGVDHSMDCNVTYSNPPLLKLTYNTTSKHTDNIKFDNVSGTIHITKATIKNRGNYTCVASNELGETTVDYETFVGGPPNNVSVEIEDYFDEMNVSLSIAINDHSNAPAQSVCIDLLAFDEKPLIVFKDYDLHIPVNHVFEDIISIDESQIYAAYYDYNVTAMNILGSTTSVTDNIFLNGSRPLQLKTVPVLLNVTEGKNYSFTCVATNVDKEMAAGIVFTFEVLIDNSTSGKKFDRLVKGPSTPHQQAYIFTHTKHTDNGTVFTCTAGDGMYVSDESTALNVFYSPIVSTPKEYGGFFNQPLIIELSVDANPPQYSTTWSKDGKKLNGTNDLVVGHNILNFTTFTEHDEGKYEVTVSNGIGNKTRATFQLYGYDGPYFTEGLSNTSHLREFMTHSDFNLTCSVKSSKPPLTSLTVKLEPTDGYKYSLHKESQSKLTIMVTKGPATSKPMNFTCIAKNNMTTATLTYNTYVGEPPHDVNVVVEVNDVAKDEKIVISARVTDKSSIPTTNISFYVEGLSKDNITKKGPFNKSELVFNNVTSYSYDELRGVGSTVKLNVYAANMVGSVLVKTTNIPIPGAKKHKKSKAGAVAAGVIVPLAVIAFIAIGVVGYFYYRRKQRRGGFSLIANSEDDPTVNSSGYRTDKVIT